MHILVFLMQKMTIIWAKFLPEDMKLKIPKISMPSQVNVQPADILGDYVQKLRLLSLAHLLNT